LLGKLKRKDRLEDPGIEGWITLNLIFNKQMADMDWTDLAHMTQGHVAGYFKRGETLVLTECGVCVG
jgi:hypothetical protein